MKNSKPTLNPVPDYGDLMTLEDFEANCRCGGFIDYNGTGYYATPTHFDRSKPARPSDISAGCIDRSFFTHVIWFNK